MNSLLSKSLTSPPVTPLALILRLLVCAAPLWLLVQNWGAMYVLDWHNHLWLMEYFGAYMQQHHQPPLVVNTNVLAGITNTLFYANYFYTVGGLLSICLGASVAFRLLAILTLLIQFVHIERAIKEIGASPGYAFFIATLVTWTTYPLTNLYSRGALTEFIAVAFFTSSVCCMLVLLYRISLGKKSLYDAIATGFFFLIVARVHPLTGMYGSVCIGLLGVIGLFYTRSMWLGVVFGLNALSGALGVLSWLYLLKLFGRQLAINQIENQPPDVFWISDYGLSPLLNLFTPVPYHTWSLLVGTYQETPFLETQCLVPLLILCVGFAYAVFRKGFEISPKNRLFCYILALGVLIFSLSVLVIAFPFLSNFMGHAFHPLQYSYRLVSYVNLGILISAWALVGLLPHTSHDENAEHAQSSAIIRAAFISIAITIAVSSLWIKLLHSDALTNIYFYDRTKMTEWTAKELKPDEWIAGVFRLGPAIDELPWTMYGQGAFAVTTGTMKPGATPPAREVQALFRRSGSSMPFGTVAPVELDLAEPSRVVTNLLPFPWNKLLVNGVVRDVSTLMTRDYPAAKKASRKLLPTCALELPTGKHTLEYRLEPDHVWQWLNTMGWAVALLWGALWMATGVAALRQPGQTA